MSTELAPRPTISADLQEKVLLGGDLSKLSPGERLSYYNAVCTSLSLNPLTRPFEYLNLSGKLVLYARKDCTDQLRREHGISVEITSRATIDEVFVVTAQAKDMTERKDESIGAVPLPHSPADRANAMMKAETKAKRRVTLSICGLGMLDETELDTVPGAKVVEGEKSRKPSDILAEHEANLVQEDNDRGEAATPGPSGSANTDAPAPLPIPALPFSECLERLRLCETVKEYSDIMNASLNSDYTPEQRTAVRDLGTLTKKRLTGEAMMSSTLMQGLIVAYVVIAGVALWEGNWWRGVYWVAAGLLTLSVLRMS